MHVVLIEQDRNHLAMLETNLIRWGFGVHTALNPDQALKFLNSDPGADMIICNCPTIGVDKDDFFKAIHEVRKTRYVYIIIMRSPGNVTGGGQSNSDLIDDVVDKTIEDGQLQAHITLGARIVAMENELNQKYLAIKHNYYQIIQLLIQLVDQFDESLGGHCRRVGKIALEIAKRHADVKITDYPIIEAAASLHDIGFIGLSKGIIGKSRTAMTGDDFQHYQTHPERGENILNQIDFLRPIARIVRHHHEQYNGRGFPDNLAEANISLPAQIVAAASLYDYLLHIERISMTSMAESIQQLRGYQLSPQLVDTLLGVHLSHLQQESDQNDKSVLLHDLKAGMVLSRDVLMRSGAFFMPGGHRLDHSTIEKLKHYEKLGNINDAVFIFK